MMFAAGFGTRMRPLTLDRPKPLVSVAGQTLIDRTLDLARGVPFAPIVVNLHYKAEMLEAHLTGSGVTTLREAPDILETGGGLKHALPHLGDGPVMTTNTDAVWQGPNPFQWTLNAWNPAKMDALLLCVPLDQTVGRSKGGDFTIGSDGQLERGGDDVYGGIQVLKTDLLDSISEPVFSLNRVWNLMSEQNRLFGVTYPGRWCDIGTPAGIPLAEELLRDE